LSREVDTFLRANERRPLFIIEPDASPPEQAHGTLDNPNKGKESESKCTPVDELARGLFSKDGEQAPSDSNGSGEIAFGGGEGIGGCCTFEEEEAEEDEDFGPDSGRVVKCVDTEGGECGEDDEDGGPSVPEGKGEVDKEFVGAVRGDVVLLDNIVDMSYSGRDEKGQNKGNNIVLARPEVDVDGVENDQQGEAPRDGIDNGGLSVREELIDDSAEN